MRFRSIAVLLMMFALTFLAPALHAQASKRLVLKDGTYQAASKWELQGDRVHYFSTERNEWEDIPSTLIDWSATDQWNSSRDHKRSDSDADNELKKEEKDEAADRAKDESASPLVAPGLRLPAEGGVFLLDRFDDKPSLAEIVQNGSELNKHTGRNILRAAVNPLPTGIKQSIELKGAHAKVQVHVPSPEIYIDIDQDTQQTPIAVENRFRIVRVQSNAKKDTRVVGNLKVNLIGHASEETNVVKSRVEKFTGDWVRVTPLDGLEPGEYAVVEMLGQKSMNTYVWDFGIDPAAPANPTAWKPEPLKQNSTGTEESPVLLPKKPV